MAGTHTLERVHAVWLRPAEGSPAGPVWPVSLAAWLMPARPRSSASVKTRRAKSQELVSLLLLCPSKQWPQEDASGGTQDCLT